MHKEELISYDKETETFISYDIKDNRIISDDYGNSWTKCEFLECGLQITRPGSVQCGYGDQCPGEMMKELKFLRNKINVKVKCNTCQSEYDEMFEGSAEFHQGSDCSSEVKGMSLIGHYGSRSIDGEIWKFIEKPLSVQEGTICDKCISELQKENKIIFAGNYLSGYQPELSKEKTEARNLIDLMPDEAMEEVLETLEGSLEYYMQNRIFKEKQKHHPVKAIVDKHIPPDDL